MPRQSRKVPIAVPVSRSNQRFRRLVAGVIGRPQTPVVQATFPTIVHPVYMKAGVRRVLKRDVSKGLSMPEADSLPFVASTVTPETMGYGRVGITHLQPQVPPKIMGTGNSVRRIVPPPSPTNNAGVRNPYNPKVKVGRRGSNARYT